MRRQPNFFQRIKDIGALGSAKITESILGGIFWLVFAAISSKSEYGEVTYLISTAMFGYGLSKIGLDKLIVVYGAKKEDVIFPAYVLGLIASSIASLLVYFLTQNVLVSILIVGLMIFDLMVAEFLSRSRYHDYSKYYITRRSLQFIFALLFYNLFGINGVVLGYFLPTLLGLVGLYKFVGSEKASLSILRPKIGFITNNYLVGLIAIFNLSGIMLLIGNLFGFTILAEFQIATQYLILLGLIPSVLAVYLLPKESQGIRNRKLKIYSIIVSSILAIVSIMSIPYAVEIFVPQYQTSILPMQIMSVSIIPNVISIITESSFLGKEKSSFVLIGGGIQTGIYFLLVAVLGSAFGLVGLAYAYLLGIVARAIVNIICKILYHVN